MIKGLLIGFFCFLLFLIIHIIVFHFHAPFEKKFRIIRNIFLSMVPVYFILFAIIPKDIFVLISADLTMTSKIILKYSGALNCFIGLMLYVFLFMGYCEFYFIIDRSISVRLMNVLENSPSQKLTKEEFMKSYPPDVIFERRFKHLLESGSITKSGNYYVNTAKGRFMAKLFIASLNLIKIWPGG